MIARALASLALCAAFLAGSLAAPAKSAPPLYYLRQGEVDLSELLAPPPDPNSAMQAYESKELDRILALRTAADVDRARGDAHRSVFVFSDVLGDAFESDRVPLAAALFEHVAADTETLVGYAKAYFARERPPGVPQTHASYPSGHAAFAACTAILLSKMVPEKRAQIFDRAAVFAESRIVAGVHYPSDVEAGWISGTAIASALFQNPLFRREFAAAKAEVRGALGLSAKE